MSLTVPGFVLSQKGVAARVDIAQLHEIVFLLFRGEKLLFLDFVSLHHVDEESKLVRVEQGRNFFVTPGQFTGVDATSRHLIVSVKSTISSVHWASSSWIDLSVESLFVLIVALKLIGESVVAESLLLSLKGLVLESRVVWAEVSSTEVGLRFEGVSIRLEAIHKGLIE